jgi:pimeloyl-ACP methyl ester carboxylesterase
MPLAHSDDGCELHWEEAGDGPAVLLTHGFASHLVRNWRDTKWMDVLAEAGWRAIAYDQRGHGESTKLYDPARYALTRLADDAIAVLDAAGADRAVLMGYSMGARVALESALRNPARVRALVLSGIGANFRDFGGREGDREVVARALEAEDPSGFPPAALVYRRFAETSGNDGRALAAFWRRTNRGLANEELAAIRVPVLVVAGDRDAVAGDPRPLADAIPGARVALLPGKDHAKAVGAREHREAVLAFLRDIRIEP